MDRTHGQARKTTKKTAKLRNDMNMLQRTSPDWEQIWEKARF
jgi:hypothetical protein